MLYKSDNVPLYGLSCGKVSWGYSSPIPKVIGANRLNYKPIFDPL